MTRRSNEMKSMLVFFSIGTLPVIYLAVKYAPFSDRGIFYLVADTVNIFAEPFRIEWLGKETLRWIGVFLLFYGLIVGAILSTRRNYRRGEEAGSAKWGRPGAVNEKYKYHLPKDKKQRETIKSLTLEEKEELQDFVRSNNKIMTRHVQIGLDSYQHKRNLHTMIIGGSGAGKTSYYCLPNVMQANTSFVILDPKGEILRTTGNLLEKKGYKIRVLNLIDMEHSDGYNPFNYLKTENDVQKLVTNIFKATTPKGSGSNDPFWDNAAAMLLSACIFYIRDFVVESQQNFSYVMKMIRAGKLLDENGNMDTSLDILFEKNKLKHPNHISNRYYDSYRIGAGKTLQSIQITLMARLEKFNLDSLARLTSYDQLHLETMGEEKTALFAITPENDSSFNFLVSVLYTQLFQQLFYSADVVHNGRLPVPVHFVMDEFANVSLPDDFDKLLAVMRSRNIFVSIVLQNISQLKKLFDKEWESIQGNCDTFLYLGGNEDSTHHTVSQRLGKETIDTNTFGKSHGGKGSYSTNYNFSGRELLDDSEVGRIDDQHCILFIRGERPVLDLKYDLMKHPNVSMTSLQGTEPYRHADDDLQAGFTLEYVDDLTGIDESKIITYDLRNIETVFELSDDDLTEEFDNKTQPINGMKFSA